MATARASADPRDRLVVELLARTGMFSVGQAGTNRTSSRIILVEP